MAKGTAEKVKTEMAEIRAKMIEHLGNLVPSLRDEAPFLTDAILQRVSKIGDTVKENARLRTEMAEAKAAMREAAALLSAIR